ncbi:MAG: permease-like cell division protein FtsX [Candidatus Rariloculaceae bacterium]
MYRLRHYLALHLQNLLGTVGQVARQPVGSLMTIVVIAIALALPAGLRVLMNNAQVLSGSWEGAVDFTVYLNMDVAEERVEALRGEVQAREDVAQVVIVSRSDALAEFRAYSGFGEALDALQENPLPHSLVVRPSSGESVNVEALADALAELPETDFVQLDTEWVERLNAIVALATRVIDIATLLLSLAVVLVIGNTIRLEINNRREEIQIVKLVGGSDGFIRRPFLYLGLFYGFAGAMIAAVTVAVGISLVTTPTRAVAELYGSGFFLTGLSPLQTLLLLGGGAGLGWAGAGIATARHLRAIEPT